MKRSKMLASMCLALICLSKPAGAVDGPAYGKGFDATLAAGGIAIKDNVVFMTWPSGAGNRERVLAAVDVRDPDTPAMLSKLVLDGFPQDVAVVGNYASIVNGRDLVLVDISNPSELSEVGRLRISEDPVSGPQGIDVLGNIAVLACRRGGVTLVDIKEPSAPVVLSTCSTAGFAKDVLIAQDIAYVACGPKGLQVLDIEQPEHPRPKRLLEAPSGVINRLAITGNTACLAAGNTLVACVSISKPAKPKWLGSTDDRHVLSPFYGSFAFDVALGTVAEGDGAGRYAFVADGESGLIVVNVTDRRTPTFAGALIEDLGLGGNMFTGLCMQGTILYVNDDSFGLRIVDVSEPSRPRLRGDGLALK